jgi:hypothetical protein
MQDMRTKTTSKPGSSSPVVRRVVSVVLGTASVGLFAFGVFGMLDVAETYGDAFGGGWGLLWILVGAIASFIGAGSVAMWQPPRSGVVGKALFWIAGVAIVVYGVLFFLVAP